jgi:2,4-dienoyl-CoA reductase (NADPH2)
VTLFEASDRIGGQFNMAKKIPGKEEFNETLRYFQKQIDLTGVQVRLGTRATLDTLSKGFDAVVLATGVRPRTLDLPGIEHPRVLSYVDVLSREKPVGDTVAIIGAGGIGFDVAEYLTHQPQSGDAIDAYLREWGVDRRMTAPGGLMDHEDPPPARSVTLCQRKQGKLGAGLGKTTGWIHRSALKKKNVTMLDQCRYERIDDDGLHITVAGEARVLNVDTIVVCAGQVSRRDLSAPLEEAGIQVHIIGGAFEAGELDARRAFDQGTRLAAGI